MRIDSIACLVGMAFWLTAAPAAAETVRLEADRDASLIEHPDGALANGAGPAFFVGRTNQETDSIRRGMLHFDVAGALPHQAIVDRVSLTLYANSGNPLTRTLRLHRVLADWGEGASSSSGGGGAPAQPGDVTWLHTFYDTDFWKRAGGQFAGSASAEQDVTDAGPVTWERTPLMEADVRLWAAAAERNFGWILIGDETVRQTVKSLGSRESSDPTQRPALEITYHLPGRP